MDPLPLDGNGYDGTYKLVGGQPSLDLVNTLAWPGTEREHEWLHNPGNVVVWAVASGLVEPGAHHDTMEGAGADELAAVHRLRSILEAVLRPLAFDEEPPPHAVDGLDREVHRVFGRRRIDPVTLDWTWEPPTTVVEVMAPVVWNAAEVLTGVDRRRLGHCPSCGWLFHDTTRNRSRRWCDMQDCGSRDKALRYYHRTRSRNAP